MDRHIPLIISESTPFERGLHLGRSAQSRVIHTVTAYMEIFQRISAQDRYVREYSETRERDKRLQSLVTTRPVTEDALHAMLADHGTSPYAICVHNQAQWSFEEQGESIASIIFDLTAGTIDVADGPPCQYEYQRYSIDKLTSYRRTNC